MQLSGWVHSFQMYKHGIIWTPEKNFKLRNVEILRQVSLFVSAGAILIKHESSPWQIALESF
ncbi:hypothetical protein D3C84_1198990 [compost metagenome]